ncbi:MAG: hypothetical protein KDC12_09135 [Flavobacteriales bacterium]|nr:hypothetical protein [Flavobacteriales bacterium]
MKHRIAAGIGEEFLQHFAMSPQDSASLTWEHAREFEMKSVMYDVVKREMINDTLHVWCWEDRRESELNHMLADFMAGITGSDLPSRRQEQYVRSFLKNLICKELPHSVELPLTQQNANPLPEVRLLERAFPPATPPPMWS